MSKTFGNVIDEYIASELKSGQAISSMYLYMEDWQNPKAVICTTEQSYDYTEVLYEIMDLKTEAKEAEIRVKALQDKIRQLERSKTEVVKAIRLLKEQS